MPTVPSSFVPRVDIQGEGEVPFQAPPVEGVRNALPEQQIRFGQATTQAGNVAFRIGAQLQDSIDESGAKEADINNYRGAQQVVNSYLDTNGKDSELQYRAAVDSLSTIANNTIDSLPNKTQKEMASASISRSTLALQGRIDQHRREQAKVYSIEMNAASSAIKEDAAIESFSTMAIPNGAFQVDRNLALIAIRNVGIAKGYPIDSPQMQALEIGVDTRITYGVVQRMIAKNDFQDGIDLVNKEVKAGRIDSKVSNSLMQSLLSNQMLQASEEASSSTINEGMVKSPAWFGNYVEITSGGKRTADPNSKTVYSDLGIDMVTGGESEVYSPNGGTITEISADEITIRLDDGNIASISKFGSTESYKGQIVNKGQVIAISDAGKDIHYSLAKIDGEGNKQFFSPDTVHKFNKSDRLEKAMPPESLSEALAIAGSIEDKELQKRTKQLIRQKWSERDAMNRNACGDLLNGQIEKLASGTLLQPSSEFGALKQSDRQKLIGGFAKENSANLMFNYMTNPAILTPEWLSENMNGMTPQAYKSFSSELDKRMKNNGILLEATIDQSQLEAVMNSAGMSNMYDNAASSKLKSDFVNFKAYVETQIHLQQTFKKGKLSMEEKKEIYKDACKDRVMSRSTSFFGVKSVSEGELISTMSEQELADPNNFVERSIGKDKYQIPIKYYKELFEQLKLAGLSNEEANKKIVARWAKENPDAEDQSLPHIPGSANEGLEDFLNPNFSNYPKIKK